MAYALSQRRVTFKVVGISKMHNSCQDAKTPIAASSKLPLQASATAGGEFDCLYSHFRFLLSLPILHSSCCHSPRSVFQSWVASKQVSTSIK